MINENFPQNKDSFKLEIGKSFLLQGQNFLHLQEAVLEKDIMMLEAPEMGH